MLRAAADSEGKLAGSKGQSNGKFHTGISESFTS